MTNPLICKIPENYPEELKELDLFISEHISGKISFKELQARRVPFGIYAQRAPETYMIRFRNPAGIILPRQIKALAETSQAAGCGDIHLTTRQAIQLHDVKLEKVSGILAKLLEAGLISRGSGGNTVRNITASWDSGTSGEELFDVTPYAMGLTDRLVAEPDSWTLPRKLKISFSNSDSDNALASINDLGFVAAENDGVPGFKVYAAGGLGLKPHSARLLHDFIPGHRVYAVARAVKTLFQRKGNRRNKHKARLRFLWESLGNEGFIKEYYSILDGLDDITAPPLEITPVENNPAAPPVSPVENNSDDFLTWKRRYTIGQRQPRAFSVIVPLRNGIISNKDASALADFSETFGENTLRLGREQNFILINIPESHLGNVYDFVETRFPLSRDPVILSHAIACAGADICTLGICAPRGVMEEVGRRLKESGLSLDTLKDIRINISGCPDSCGQHQAADLGFFGRVARKNHVSYPAYNIVAGARFGRDGARLAEKIDVISARDLPEFLVRFFSLFLEIESPFASFSEYLDSRGKEDIAEICAQFREIPSLEENADYFRDWGSDKIFSMAERGTGECSAGLFDLVEYDLDTARGLLKESDSADASRESKEKSLYQILLHTSRSLLITRGEEAKSDDEIFRLFRKHFIESGLIEKSYEDIILMGEKMDYTGLTDQSRTVSALADDVHKLYHLMDDSLKFPGEYSQARQKEAPAQESAAPHTDLFKDLRGVVCPFNFVKTKVELARIIRGQVLNILLDDGDPIRNVPKSLRSEGHKILKEEKQDDGHWSVLIEKA